MEVFGMRIVRSFAIGLAVLALVATSGAFASNPVTVGDFLSAYARALNIELPANAGTDTVVAALKASGVKLDTVNPAKALTQGDVVRIGKANGLRLSTRNADSAFSLVEMNQFFTSYGNTLARTNDTRLAASDNPPGDPASHANTDKGKKKGRPFQSPTEPE
jgi:hypothetical protein